MRQATQWQRCVRRPWITLLGVVALLLLTLGPSAAALDALTSSFVSLSPMAVAQNAWATSGPYGGNILRLVASPNFAVNRTLFAGTENGLFRSTDEGATWSAITPAPERHVTALAISPYYNSDRTLWAGFLGNGLWVSTDSGDNWRQITSVIPEARTATILDIAILPRSGSERMTLFVSVESPAGIYRSRDEGLTWTRVLVPALGARFVALGVSADLDPRNRTIFAASSDGHISRSTDGGDHWEQKTIYEGPDSFEVRSIAVSPNYREDSTLFVGTFGLGTLKSTRGGENNSWSQIHPDPKAAFVALAPNYNENNISARTVFVCGPEPRFVRMSTTGGDGAQWDNIGQGLDSALPQVLLVSPRFASDRKLWLGTKGSGVFIGRNPGPTLVWQPTNAGLSAYDIPSLSISPLFGTEDRLLLAGALPGGVLLSRDGGTNWSFANAGLPANDSTISAVAIASYRLPLITFLAGNTTGRVFRSVEGLVSWTQVYTVPNRSKIEAFAVSPNFASDGTCFLIAGTRAFKSADRGRGWQPILTLDTGLRAVAISPLYDERSSSAVSKTLFVGGEQGAIFRTTDGGNGWQALDGGLPNTATVLSIAISPNYAEDGTVLAGFAGNQGGIIKSTNSGNDWTLLDSVGLPDDAVHAILFSPAYAQDRTIYVGTQAHGVYCSQDGGASFQPFNEGLEAPWIASLASAPLPAASTALSGLTIFAGTWGRGVWQRPRPAPATPTPTATLSPSPTWTATATPSPTRTPTDTETPTPAFSSTPTSSPRPTRTWTATPTPEATGTLTPTPTISPSATATVIRRMWLPLICKEFPKPWQLSGLAGSQVKSLASDPGNPQIVYAGTAEDIYRHLYCGGAWYRVNLIGGTPVGVYSIAIAPPPSGHLFAATWGRGVFRSVDAGASWQPVNSGLGSLYVNAVAISPNYVTDQTVYAGTDSHGVYKSTDRGNSWTPASSGLTTPIILALSISPSNPQLILAGTYDQGIFRSTNGGQSWTQMFIANSRVWSIATSPANPQVYYAGTDGGVYRSDDQGQYWTLLTSFQGGKTYAVAVSPLDHRKVYAGTSASGVFLSVDGGHTWKAINEGLGNKGVQALSLDLERCHMLYAGTDDGIWQWTAP